MSSDFLLSDTTHDLDISSGTLRVVESDDIQVVAQRVRIALLLRAGEYFLNTQSGVPYLSDLLIYKNNQAYTDQYIRSYVQTIEDVDSVNNFTSVSNPYTRQLAISMDIATPIGSITLSPTGVQI